MIFGYYVDSVPSVRKIEHRSKISEAMETANTLIENIVNKST